VRLARELRPDVCLLDIRMPEMDGLEATRELAGRGVSDPMAVIVITTFDLDEYVHRALRDGARGFLLKDAGPELLVQAPREEDVLLAVTRGRTNAEIADDLRISLSTTKTHLASLMAKLNARNRVELTMWTYETRRITLGVPSEPATSRPP
jgi:DNA-binding NarL/FixJ family response regulator